VANNKKVVQQLQVLLETMGYQKVDKELKSVNKSMERVRSKTEQTATAQNRLKRTQEGVHKTSLAQGKEFSRQAQGLGGLVRAYATIAANVFALSSAFLVLKRAADFDSMMISANSMTKNMGVNVATLAKHLQVATGYNLSFANSLEVTNKALAAGFNASQFSELGEIVAKVSQTFGGSIEANMNRVTQAILRGRTETLATMGIVIDLEQAYSSYALTLGKTRQELTKFEEQQATLNAFLEEGQKQVGGIQQDPNPYDKMLISLQDVSQKVMTTLSKNVFNPLIGLMNESERVALSLIAVLAAVFARNLTPDMQAYASAAKKSIEAVSASNSRRLIAQKRVEAELVKTAKKNFDTLKTQKVRFLQQWAREELKKPEVAKKAHSAIRTIAEATEQEIIAGTKRTNRALATVQAQITSLRKNPKAIASSSVKGVMGTSKEGELFTAAAISGSAAGKNLEGAIKSAGLSAQGAAARFRLLTTSVASTYNSLRLASSQAKLATLNFINQNGVIIGTAQAYKHAVRSLRLLAVETKRVSNAFIIATTAARIFGTTVALIGAAVNKALPALMMLWMAFEIGKAILDKFRGSTGKAIKAFNEGIKTSQEETLEFTQRAEDLKQKILEFENNKTFYNLAQTLSFAANATSELSMGVQNLRKVFDNLASVEVGGISVSAIQREQELIRQLGELKRKSDKDYLAWITDENKGFFSVYKDQWSDAIDHAEEELERVREKIEAAANGMARLFKQTNIRIEQAVNIRDIAGLDTNTVEKTIGEGISRAVATLPEIEGKALQTAYDKIRSGASQEEIEGLIDSGALNADAVRYALNIISNSLNQVSQETMAASRAIQSFSDTALDIKKKLKEGENVFLDKVGLNEEAKLVDQLINNIKTIKNVGGKNAKELMNLFQEGDGKTIADYLGLDTAGLNIDQLEEKLKAIISRYNDLAKAQLQLESEQKINKLTQDSLKLEEQRGVTATRSIEIAKESAELKQREFEVQAGLVDNQIKLIDEQLKQRNLDEDRVAYLNLQKAELEAQRNLYEENSRLINPILDAKLKELSIERELLKLQQGNTTARLSMLQNSKLFVRSAQELYNIELDIFKQQQEQNNLRAVGLRNKIQEISARRDANGQLSYQDTIALQETLRELAVLMQDAQVLAVEQSRRGVELLARTGNFEANSQAAVLEFIKAGEEVAKNFESAGARLAKAALTTMDAGIDLLIDNLLSGEESFGESIKAILRDSLGGILKDNIKSLARSGLAEFFGNKQKSPEEIGIEQLNQNIMQTQLLAIIAGKEGFDPEVIKQLGIDLQGTLGSLIQNIAGGSSLVASGGSNIFGQLINAFIGGFFANGGVVQGGINRYANGTITSGPEIAMIGEGRNREAIVPLPNNREIPVQLMGDSGQKIEINQMFDFRNADVASERRLRVEAERIKQEAFQQVFSEIGKGGRYAKAVGRR
jgi:hypothetical protein